MLESLVDKGDKSAHRHATRKDMDTQHVAVIEKFLQQSFLWPQMMDLHGTSLYLCFVFVYWICCLFWKRIMKTSALLIWTSCNVCIMFKMLWIYATQTFSLLWKNMYAELKLKAFLIVGQKTLLCLLHVQIFLTCNFWHLSFESHSVYSVFLFLLFWESAKYCD